MNKLVNQKMPLNFKSLKLIKKFNSKMSSNLCEVEKKISIKKYNSSNLKPVPFYKAISRF